MIAERNEREVYEAMWSHPEYRNYSPGEEAAHIFLRHARPEHGTSVIDFGCGTGRGALALALFGGCNVTMVDFAENCLDDDILPMLETQKHALRFLQHDLSKPLQIAAPLGFCCDMLEHIPTDNVRTVVSNCLHAAQHCFFQISTVPDNMGALIGQPLHLTVRPHAWWAELFRQFDCVVHWAEDAGNCSRFYVTAWPDAQAVVDAGVLNTEESQVLENVKTNASAGWQQVTPHITNDLECLIVGGGPSANECLEEIRAYRAAGAKLITLNGAYNWCLDNGLTPSAQIVVDARAFNARFTKPVVDDCRYLISSQCDPSVFEGLPHDRTFIWHTSSSFIADELNKAYEVWFGIPGGSTVLLRAIPLMRLLGYHKFRLFGCDSCVGPQDETHAYAQPENPAEIIAPVNVGGRIFRCLPYHIAQAQEFVGLIKHLGNEIEMIVHGDGLLAWIVQHGYNVRMDHVRKMRDRQNTLTSKRLMQKRRRRM